MDKQRVPPIRELRKLLSGMDLQEAVEELERASLGDDCHDTVAKLLRMPLEELPKEVDPHIEPGWLRTLLFCILAHRVHTGL